MAKSCFQFSQTPLVASCAHGDDEPEPAPHFPFSQNSHGMADLLNFKRKPWPTLVMPKCGKLKAFPPCAVARFMSNIKMFPMALLPGWPFAPNKTPGAKTV